MPANYEMWAKSAREEVREIERQHVGSSKSLENHNVQTQIAFCNIEQQMINMENRQRRIFEVQQEMLASQGRILNVLNAWRGDDVSRQVGVVGGIGTGIMHRPPAVPQQSIIGTTFPPASVGVHIGNPQQQQQQIFHIGKHSTVIAKPLSSVLRNLPRVPVFSNSLPKTVERLVFEHEVVYKLTEYQNV
jgi:hypothetical protein